MINFTAEQRAFYQSSRQRIALSVHLQLCVHSSSQFGERRGLIDKISSKRATGVGQGDAFLIHLEIFYNTLDIQCKQQTR